MINLFLNSIDSSKYIVATYEVRSTKSLRDAAWNIAIGQSVGNPTMRSVWETDDLFQNHSCVIVGNESAMSKITTGTVVVGFPIVNIDFEEDGVSQLMCQLMGGQLDIDSIVSCRLVDLEFPPEILRSFQGPKYGIDKIREYTGVPSTKPLLGGIVKPKVGITPEVLLEMVKEMVEGGVNFIKEDEIMSNPKICPIAKRVPLVMDYLKGRGVVYSVCINADAPYLLDRVRMVHDLGGNSVHVNFWCGLGSYKAIRKLDLPLFVHFQKSGDKILTDERHAFSMSWDVMCKIVSLSGVDFAHAGMWGGYLSDNEEDLKKTMSVLTTNGTVPALSCGMQPGLVDAIRKRFGNDWMANVGGAFHGHPMGTLAGVKAMRQAIDGNHGDEFYAAVAKWGKIN